MKNTVLKNTSRRTQLFTVIAALLIVPGIFLWISSGSNGDLVAALPTLEINEDQKLSLTQLISHGRLWSIVFGGMILAGVALFITFVYKPITRGVNNIIDVLDNSEPDIVASKLDLLVEQTSHSKIRQVQQLISKQLIETRQRIANMNDTVSNCGDTTTQLSMGVARVADSVSSQNEELDQIATAINEMSATIQEVARNMSRVATAATKAREDAQTGAVQATEAIGAIDNLDRQVNLNADLINEVHKEAININVLIDVINGIADQTNLLALNTAIEAARAGEQGRGFAVVADEVRVLATRTSESTHEIETMLTNLSAKSGAAVESMQKAKGQAEHNGNSVEIAAISLANISGEIRQIDDMNTQAASAMEVQSTVAEEINQKVQNI